MSLINKLNFSIIEKRLKTAYSNKFKEFGINPKSVFWKNSFTQDLRLELIINILLKFNNLNNGIYFATIITNDNIFVQQIIVN